MLRLLRLRREIKRFNVSIIVNNSVTAILFLYNETRIISIVQWPENFNFITKTRSEWFFLIAVLFGLETVPKMFFVEFLLLTELVG